MYDRSFTIIVSQTGSYLLTPPRLKKRYTYPASTQVVEKSERTTPPPRRARIFALWLVIFSHITESYCCCFCQQHCESQACYFLWIVIEQISSMASQTPIHEITLKTRRLLLRPVRDEDIPDVFSLRSNPKVMFWTWEYPCSPAPWVASRLC